MCNIYPTPMLKSNLCDHRDAYILDNGTITITGVKEAGDAAARQTKIRKKELIFKNCALFTECISMINNTQKDNAKDLDVVVMMYGLIEYINNYSKTLAMSLTNCETNLILTRSVDCVVSSATETAKLYNTRYKTFHVSSLT